MDRLKLSNVSSRYGAPMGRRTYLPVDRNKPVKLQLNRLRWVDGDYDEGGAYWGHTPGTAIYYAKGTTDDDQTVAIFVRATSRDDAKRQVRLKLPAVKFYR